MDNYENNINTDIGADNEKANMAETSAGGPIITDETIEEKEKIDSIISSNDFSKNEFKAKAKHSVVMPSIKAAFCIMLAAVLGFAAYFVFFNTNIKGEWVVDGSNVHTVLNFMEDNVVEMTIGSITVKGSYEILDSSNDSADSDASKNNEDRVNISIVYSTTSFMYGDFTYQVTGNAFTGRTLKITDDSNNSMTLSSGKKETILTPDKERNYTEKLVGSWENENMTYTFTKDGFMYLDFSYISFECSYSDNGEKIFAKYYTPEETNIEIDFAFQNDNTVEIDGLVFTRKR